jgi:uncharacterized protein YqhQ
VAQDLNLKALIFSTQFICVFPTILNNVQTFSSNETQNENLSNGITKICIFCKKWNNFFFAHLNAFHQQRSVLNTGKEVRTQ